MYPTGHGAHVPLLQSPLLLYNNSIGTQHICPQVPHYSEKCVSALDTIYGSRDGDNIINELMLFCTDDCLKPLVKHWKDVIHDVAMPIFLSKTLCQSTERGYCAQQFIMSDQRFVLEQVDHQCIKKWCPLVCSSKKDGDEMEYLQCCASAIVNQTFPPEQAIELYGVTPKMLHQRDKVSYI